jgi:hypothetical protein
MQLTRKTNKTKQDIGVAGKSYKAVNQFIYFGSQINSKNSIKKIKQSRYRPGVAQRFPGS